LKNEGILQKNGGKALPLTTNLDLFPTFCLEVAWYLAVDNWCGLDVKSMSKIKVLTLIS
jgi:hypothetical protein